MFLFISVIPLSLYWIINRQMHNQKKLTVEVAAELLFEYIYPNKDYFSLCTVYYADGEGALGKVSYPAYEFEIPDAPYHTRRQIYFVGESQDEEYYYFDFLSWNYSIDLEGEGCYTHANHYSVFAINSLTGEIIQQRTEDKETYLWLYNEKFEQIWEEHPVNRK